MRQIFVNYPYISPREPGIIAERIRRHGTLRSVAAGEVLKRGGDANRLFLLEEGLCAYYVAGDVTGRPAIMSLILPGTSMCDMTSSVGKRCNVETRAVVASRVWCTSPDFFDRHVFNDPEASRIKYQHAVAKQESAIEGMIANFTLPPEQRLKILMKALLLYEDRLNASDTGEWHRLPYRISAETLGQTVNLTRQSVTEIISGWRRAGLARRVGQDLDVRRTLFDDVYDWIDHRGGCLPDWRPV